MSANRSILLLEDDTVDAMNLARAFQELGIRCPLVHVENGEQGLAHLRDHPELRPVLIFSDINMPRMSGLEFLQQLKSNPDLRAIPVVILTTSGEERDRRESFELGAAGYLIKPPDYPAFLEMMRVTHRYWALNDIMEV